MFVTEQCSLYDAVFSDDVIEGVFLWPHDPPGSVPVPGFEPGGFLQRWILSFEENQDRLGI